MQPEHKVDRDGSRHQTGHGDPNGYLVPWLRNQPQQEKTQRPLCHGHADNGKCLPDSLKKNGIGKVVQVPYVGDPLPEPIVSRDRSCRGVAHKEELERKQESTLVSTVDPWTVGPKTYECKVVNVVVDAITLHHFDPCVGAEDNEDEGHDRHNPHDCNGPRTLTSHSHLGGCC